MRRAVVPLVLCLLAGCGGSPARHTAAGVSPAPSGGAASSPAALSSSPPAAPAPSASGSTTSPKPAGSTSPRPAPPVAHDVYVRASVDPPCAAPGGTFTLTVHTQPQAGVAWGAKYADGEYGAAPPFGRGYGGSASGTADKKGLYVATWTVAPTAPAGAGTVEVVVGWRGKQGGTHVPFRVAAAGHSC